MSCGPFAIGLRKSARSNGRRAWGRPDPEAIATQYSRLRKYKLRRSQLAVSSALDELARAVDRKDANLYEAVIEAIWAGATHGETVGRLRQELGFGQPLLMTG